MIKTISLPLLICSLFLAGCASSPSTPDSMSNTGSVNESEKNMPAIVDEKLAESSGDVDKDFDEIDGALDKLNVDEDFSDLDAKNLLGE